MLVDIPDRNQIEINISSHDPGTCFIEIVGEIEKLIKR